MSAEPLEELRAALARAGRRPAQEHSDEMLQMMLDVEEGDVHAAARAIAEAHAAEERRPSVDELSATETAATEPPLPAPSAMPQGSVSAATPLSFFSGSSIWDSQLVIRVWRILSIPFSLAQAFFLLCLRVLRRANPLARRGASGRFEMTEFPQNPSASARHWIDRLERDTGGTTTGRADSTDMRVALPPFFPGSYAEALKHVKDNIQILAVVLTSHAHSDDDEFRTRVLADPGLVETLSSPSFAVWGGDVHAREAFQVATLLEASTFPFLAFIALQPRRSRSRGGAVVAHPAVLSRLEGSPRSVLSAPAIRAHIADVLLPRTNVYLGSLRKERHQRELERQLKDDQDRAYDEAWQRDQERVMQRRAESERRGAEARERADTEAALAAEHAKVAAWRSWARAHVVPPEPDSALAPLIRVSVHLPDGRNLQRRFHPTDTLEHLHAYVDTADVDNASRTPDERPDGYEHTYAFHLVQTYPRRVLDKHNLYTPLEEVSGLGPSANLVVETLLNSGNAAAVSSDEEDD
ncbi:UBX domain-containing protein 10 [Malassezia sp. CBS 17886]|nr:UBX domain-containing protein 10 [Malassezia sp. CBS 17886]